MSTTKYQRTGNTQTTEQRGNTSRHSGNEFAAVDRLLNIKEAAEVLGIAPGSLYYMVSQRRVPFVRISNRCLRFSKAALEKFISDRSVPAI
jgi:excisionase family DNA binding protein